jgi:hypothetical protein
MNMFVVFGVSILEYDGKFDVKSFGVIDWIRTKFEGGF